MMTNSNCYSDLSCTVPCFGGRRPRIVASSQLSNMIQLKELVNEKAILMATYALCGFANFASIGIQLGGIGGIAPKRRKELAKIVFKAMIGGALASWLTATIVGILI